MTDAQMETALDRLDSLPREDQRKVEYILSQALAGRQDDSHLTTDLLRLTAQMTRYSTRMTGAIR